jgi:hypothetical protein
MRSLAKKQPKYKRRAYSREAVSKCGEKKADLGCFPEISLGLGTAGRPLSETTQPLLLNPQVHHQLASSHPMEISQQYGTNNWLRSHRLDLDRVQELNFLARSFH